MDIRNHKKRTCTERVQRCTQRRRITLPTIGLGVGVIEGVQEHLARLPTQSGAIPNHALNLEKGTMLGLATTLRGSRAVDDRAIQKAFSLQWETPTNHTTRLKNGLKNRESLKLVHGLRGATGTLLGRAVQFQK